MTAKRIGFHENWKDTGFTERVYTAGTVVTIVDEDVQARALAAAGPSGEKVAWDTMTNVNQLAVLAALGDDDGTALADPGEDARLIWDAAAGAYRHSAFGVARTLDEEQRAQERTNIGALGVVRVTRFVSSGTWTPHANMISATIECIGGGGGGGGVAAQSGTTIGCGGGGGASGLSRTLVAKSGVGETETVTIGAGGDGGAPGNNAGTSGGATSVGTLCAANGGGGGGGAADAGRGSPGAGASTGTGNMIASTGAAGEFGVNASNSDTIVMGGGGADGPYGGGGRPTVNFTGTSARGYGSGGGGGHRQSAGPGAAGGGAGSPGIAIITEFCSE